MTDLTFIEAEKIFETCFKAQQNLSKNKKEETWYAHKYRHSYEVLDAGLRIISLENNLKNLSASEKENAKIALLLHDLGRFYQYINGQFVIEFDHALASAEILKQNYQINNLQILLPIKHHQSMQGVAECQKEISQLPPNEQEVIIKITKLVKDADKLANLLHAKSQNTFSTLEISNFNLKLSDYTLNCVSNKCLVDYTKCGQNSPTIFDFILVQLCWRFDIYFASTLKIIDDENVSAFFIGELRKYAELNLEKFKNTPSTQSDYKKLCSQIDTLEKLLTDMIA
jgi:hypothetical protein